MNEDKIKLEQYASLKRDIADLEEQLEMLKPVIVSIVEVANPLDKTIEADGIGTFTMVPKRKYTYSEATKTLEVNYKQAKEEEEAKGIATYIEQPYLKFTPLTIK